MIDKFFRARSAREKTAKLNELTNLLKDVLYSIREKHASNCEDIEHLKDYLPSVLLWKLMTRNKRYK